MNRNKDHYRQRGRGCARNSANHYGGSLGYTIGSEPLIPERPDLSIYETTKPSAGGAYSVDVSEDIAGMPVYMRKTTVGGRLGTYEAPTAGYRFEPSNAAGDQLTSFATAAGPPFNEVVPQNGRACSTGGGGCPFLGGVSAAEYDASQPLFIKNAGSRKIASRKLATTRKRKPTTIKFKRSRFNTTRKSKKQTTRRR